MRKVQDAVRDRQEGRAETGVDALVEKVEDIQKIMAFEILMTPGLVINGEVKTAGRVPNVEEIKKLILAAKAA